MIVSNVLMNTTARAPIVMVEGKGSWLMDGAGNRYLDFVQGRGTNSLGHAPSCVWQALAEQASKLINPGPYCYSEATLRLAQELVERSAFDEVFLANSGTEANECAIKLARKWGRAFRGGAHETITLFNAFHGRTWAAMSATGRPEYSATFGPLVPGFPKATMNDIPSVERQITARTAAVMIEVVQGQAGVLCADPAFLQALRQLCDTHKLLLVFDEVQTGMGRLGRLFGYEHFGVEPDILTLGKGIAGGAPLSAVLAKEHACVFVPGEHGGTFNGNPLVTAAGLAVLKEVSKRSFLQEVRDLASYLSLSLAKLSSELGLPGEGGIGLLRRLDLGQPIGPEVVAYARDRLAVQPSLGGSALLLNSPSPNLLRFLPALNVTRSEIDQMIEGLRFSILVALRQARAVAS